MTKERDGAAVVVVQPSRERGHKNPEVSLVGLSRHRYDARRITVDHDHL